MNLSRRDFARSAVAGAAAAALPPVLATPASAAAAASEADELRRLHRQAVAEGGKVTVYMGGDAPGFWDFIPQAFTAAFPDIRINLVTDLSKYHNARIDNQLATGDLVADVAILQTTQDFDRWKAAGELLRYRPVGFDQLFADAKDPDGFWSGVFYAAFSPMVSITALPADPADFRASDLLAPAFAGKIISTYPNDDDAVLFQYKLNIEHYGWQWLDRLVAQNPTFLRGVPGAAAGVADGSYLATPVGAGSGSPHAQQILPRHDHFATWAQRAAILRRTAHENTAKLFLSWLLSNQTQKNVIATWTWSPRADVAPPAWLKPLTSYKTTDPRAFPAFMSDQAAVDRFRSQIELYVGPAHGADPGDPSATLGRTPGRF